VCGNIASTVSVNDHCQLLNHNFETAVKNEAPTSVGRCMRLSRINAEVSVTEESVIFLVPFLHDKLSALQIQLTEKDTFKMASVVLRCVNEVGLGNYKGYYCLVLLQDLS